MAKASIHFEDTEDGVLLTLHFDDDLPEDPGDASDAQMQAMVAFTQFLAWGNEDSPNGEPDFDDSAFDDSEFVDGEDGVEV